MSPTLSRYLKASSLVSVHRKDIDDRGVQGFLLGLSERLLALEYVYDFQIDGVMVLRREDITDLKQTATDAFQERLLRQDGVQPGAQIPVPLELGDWGCLIRQLSAQCCLMILERELGPSPEFAIGRVRRAMAAQLEFQTFTGTGDWSSRAKRIKYAQLTCLQVNTRYLDFFARHFQRVSKLNESSRD